MSGELKVSEYEALRKELEATSKRVYDSVFFAVTVSAVIVGYGIEKRDLWVTLLPLLVLSGAYVLVCQSFRSERRIVAYLRLFHETRGSGAAWETLLHKVRVGGREVSKGTFPIWPVAAQYQLLWLCGLVSVLAAWLVSDYVHWIAPALPTFAWGIMAWRMLVANARLRGGGEVEQRFYSSFRKAAPELGLRVDARAE